MSPTNYTLCGCEPRMAESYDARTRWALREEWRPPMASEDAAMIIEKAGYPWRRGSRVHLFAIRTAGDAGYEGLRDPWHRSWLPLPSLPSR